MKYLLRLYPKAWRERYGEEFDALLEQRAPGVLDSVDVMRGALDAQVQAAVHARGKGRTRGNEMSWNRADMRDELQAMLAAREELGPAAEQHLVEHFLDLLEERTVPAGGEPRTFAPIPYLPVVRRWLSALLVLWVLAGISSIAAGFPWSLSSTAPAQIFATAVLSGYAVALIVLVLAVCMTSLTCAVARQIRSSSPPHSHPRT